MTKEAPTSIFSIRSKELWLAGGNGQGDQFGLWLPAANSEASPVVRIGSNFQGYGFNGMIIEGSSLSAYLLGFTAFHLLSKENAPTRAAVNKWADPECPRADDPCDARAVNEALGIV